MSKLDQEIERILADYANLPMTDVVADRVKEAAIKAAAEVCENFKDVAAFEIAAAESQKPEGQYLAYPSRS